MNAGGETADQAVKMTLQGIEVVGNLALKAGEAATKSLAATLYAILTDRKKVRGKTRLNTLLKSGKELKVFAIRHEDLEKFCTEAKRYGVLYSVLKEKNNTDGICDIMVRAEDAAKISRIVDKFELATIDTRALRESIMAERDEKENPFKDVTALTDKQHDELVEMLMDSTKEQNKERRTVEIIEADQNPKHARTKKKSDSQFEHSFRKANVAEDTTFKEKRTSVRDELKEIKTKQSVDKKLKTNQRDHSKRNSRKINRNKPKRKVR